MGFRRGEPVNRVEFLHDGELLEGERGESLVHALIAADRLVLARSPKLHRPRGPFCLRAACDGCLMRVNGVPNVLGCRTRLLGGETVETQNVLGSREVDLLSATDFLFPRGMDPHRLFAGVRGVSGVVTKLARRIAGLGKLPDSAEPVTTAKRREVDLLIVGGGQSGLACAEREGAAAVLLDDGLELGGKLRLLDRARAADLVTAARASGAELHAQTTAVGIYREPDDASGFFSVLAAHADRVTLFRARRLHLATGCHDAVPRFPGGDLPGVMSGRAALALESGDVVPAQRLALVGRGPLIDACAERFRRHVVVRVEDAEDVERAVGTLTVRGLVLRTEGGSRRVDAGALVFEDTPSPAFELAVQAGARTEFRPGTGYVPVLDDHGEAAPNVRCSGSVTGRAQRSISVPNNPSPPAMKTRSNTPSKRK